MIKGTTPPFEIPSEMRAVAERSVEQAKLAFNNYMQAAQEAVSTFEERVKASQVGAQELLKELGSPDLLVDGEYGDATRATVKRFQATHPPLKVDGWAGVQTCATVAIELEKLKGNHCCPAILPGA